MKKIEGTVRNKNKNGKGLQLKGRGEWFFTGNEKINFNIIPIKTNVKLNCAPNGPHWTVHGIKIVR